MKPTPQITSPFTGRRLPLTDFNYQATLETPRTSSSSQKVRILETSRPLWKLSTGFLRAEAAYDYASELALFIAISTLSAWSILTALIWIPRMVHA